MYLYTFRGWGRKAILHWLLLVLKNPLVYLYTNIPNQGGKDLEFPIFLINWRFCFYCPLNKINKIVKGFGTTIKLNFFISLLIIRKARWSIDRELEGFQTFLNHKKESFYTRTPGRKNWDKITSENVVNKQLALRMVHPDSLSYRPSQSQVSSHINKR